MELRWLINRLVSLLLVFGVFIQFITTAALSDRNECARNFTRIEDINDPTTLGNVTALALNERRAVDGVFQYKQWIFPSLQFSCDANISSFVVRAEETNYTMNSPPLLSIWKVQTDTITQGHDNYFRIQSNISARVEYEQSVLMFVIDPPLSVSSGHFIGFGFSHNGEESHKITFLDKGEGSAPVSHHTDMPNPFISTDPSSSITDIRFVPLISPQFDDIPTPTTTAPTTEVTSMTLPSTSDTPPSTTVTPTTATTLPPGTPAPALNVAVVAGVIVTVLFLILIVFLIVFIALIMLKKQTKQKIYEVPIEPAPPNMDNPMYQGVVPNVTQSQAASYEANQGSHHIYATPSPTMIESPHPPAESHHALAMSQAASQHYEFAEHYAPNANESHYEMEPVPTSSPTPHIHEDPEYAQPTLSIQPYEVPLTALQATMDKHVSPTSMASNQSTKEHIYSVLEEGIYVPTEEERQSLTSSSTPRPSEYSQATVNGTIRNIDNTKIYSEMGKKYEGSLQRDGFFQQEDSYWRPASSKTALYDQLSKRKYREIVRQQIQIIKHLGSGQFGTVNMGLWQTSVDTTDVAVKTLQPMASDTDKVKFLQEAAIMGQFLHPNVVKLYGVVTVGEPVMIVLEYMQKGDLRNYLLAKRPQPGELVPDDLSDSLLRFCREISAGMNYLANKAFVHRDLAARNILLSSETTCKIGDFGMSRDLEQSSYYITHGGKIPVKWTSPEALNFRKYSTASDVWSFGCVMYEIWSLGHKPFEGYTNLQCMQLIGSGFRLAPPPGCPRPLYELMIRCWHSDSSVRPMFSAIFNMLSHSTSHLLSWSDRDLEIHPQVATLGAPLEVTDDLYPELQDYYIDRRSNGKNKKGSRTADW